MQAVQPIVTRRLATVFAALAVLAGAPGTLRAGDVSCDNTADFPCSYQIARKAMQPVPRTFKFQARISQAKLPIGEGRFNKVYVKVLSGTNVKCIEEFGNPIEVRDSVLNLEIGRNMNCDLPAVLAENAGALAFQVCLGSINNCLKPIDLATVPYAVKSNYAYQTENAYKANFAGQAWYSHRVTADTNLHTAKTLGTGYFDFATPPANHVRSFYATDVAYEPYRHDGFLQWTPVANTGSKRLHLSAKANNTHDLGLLNELLIHSAATRAFGTLEANGRLTVTTGGFGVNGASSLDGTLLVTQKTTISSGGIEVTGAATLHNTLLVDQKLTVASGGLEATGPADLHGTLTVDEKVTAKSDLEVQGSGEVWSSLNVGSSLTVSAGGMHVTGDSDIAGSLELSGDSALLETPEVRCPASSAELKLDSPTRITGDLVVEGQATFQQLVTMEAGAISDQLQDQLDGRYLWVTGEVRDVRFGGDLDVVGAFTADEAAVGYDLDVTHDVWVHNDLYVDGAIHQSKGGAKDGARRLLVVDPNDALVLNPDLALGGGTVAFGGLQVDGDLTVRNGTLKNLRPGPEAALDLGADPGVRVAALGAADGRRICFLTQVRWPGRTGSDPEGLCEVVEDGAQWLLKTGAGAGRTACKARCLTW